MLEFCCHTHWATVLVVHSNCLAQSNPQRLCILHPDEQSQRDQVSTRFKVLLPRIKGYPCQTGWARSGGPARTRQVVGWRISANAFYSSNPDPQHPARVWTSEIQIRIHCNVPHVTCTPFGRVFQSTYMCNLLPSWSHLLDMHQKLFTEFSRIFGMIEFGKLYPKKT